MIALFVRGWIPVIGSLKYTKILGTGISSCDNISQTTLCKQKIRRLSK